MPLYIELVLGLSASASGLALIALMCGATLGSMVAGRIMARVEHYKRVPVIALAVATVALAAFALWPGAPSLATVVVLLTIGGAGLGPMYPTTTVVIQNAVPPHQFGIATGTMSFFRQLGGALIVAIFAAIVLGSIDTGAGVHGPLAARGAGVAAEVAVLFRWVFAAATAFTVIAFVALALIEEQPLRGPGRTQPASSKPVAAE
jgi:MFS family permease